MTAKKALMLVRKQPDGQRLEDFSERLGSED